MTPKLMVLAARRSSEVTSARAFSNDEGRRAQVHVRAGGEGVHQLRIVGQVREDAKLDLRVVGAEDDPARRRDEGRADRPPELGADGDVLQVRVGRRQTPGGGDGLVEAGVDPAGPRVDAPRERVDVRPLELVELAVLEDARRQRVFLGERLEHLGVGRAAALRRALDDGEP